jgi:ABC-type lipoprotein export system ATPase subunit
MSEVSSSLILHSVSYRRGGDGRNPLVLDEADACFEAGRVSVIRGPVGAGKSTVIMLLGLLVRPTSGEVRWQGEAVSRYVGRHRDAWRRRVGIALQDAPMLGELSALENVMFPLVVRSMKTKTIIDRCEKWLERVGAAHLGQRRGDELSSGERQRVALARALVTEPEVVLVDEPTANQDDHGATLVCRNLEHIARGGAIVVAASHDDRLSLGPESPTWKLGDGRLVKSC